MESLTSGTFAEAIKEGTVFVKFAVSNGCKPCTEFKPIYEIASQTPNGIKYCEYVRETLPTKNEDLDGIEKKYQISSFPTVLLFENGENKGPVQKYKFYPNRYLSGLILDEQKRLFNQQCYVEDLSIELQSRQP